MTSYGARIAIRQAGGEDAEIVCRVLSEAALWLELKGIPLWKKNELSREHVLADVTTGSYFIAFVTDEPAGTVKYQLEDHLFWPDVEDNQSAYIHRLAVRRSFSGGEVSRALLEWATERARTDGRTFLRLDCESSRKKLRAIYEEFGFAHHSDRVVGPYHVSRYQLTVNSSHT